MIKKKWICIIISIIVSLLSVTSAGGLFPSMDELFGTAMPSIGLVIGRNADEQTDTSDGSQEIYRGFDSEDYLAFGLYLAGVGARITDYSLENDAITVAISVRDAKMSFSYNWSEKTAVAIYPTGTRAETEKESVVAWDSVLPPTGGVMPSAKFAINRKPDEQTTNEEGLIQTWNQFSDEDYIAFSAYLAETGATLKDSSTENGILTAEIGLNGFSFWFVFNWNAQTASLTYPKGTTPETSHWNSPRGSGSILPEISSFGKELPRISVALERDPTAEETLKDGGLRETYLDFNEADYNTFSQYLQRMECTLEDYYTDENGALVINLSNCTGKMTFSYDALRHTGTVIYPGQTRVERAWEATPTPEPKETEKPETEVNASKYNEWDCWSIAYEYFLNLRWKDPQSLKIHGHTATYSNGSYIFTIDYSAANGFGGTNREYYWITVDASTGSITLAFGNN